MDELPAVALSQLFWAFAKLDSGKDTVAGQNLRQTFYAQLSARVSRMAFALGPHVCKHA
jgi:hypothetical protein